MELCCLRRQLRLTLEFGTVSERGDVTQEVTRCGTKIKKAPFHRKMQMRSNIKSTIAGNEDELGIHEIMQNSSALTS
jgi:hypothetical protein